MMRVGESFNEAVAFIDEVTSRPGKRLTVSGLYNQTPTYHFKTAFSDDSKYLILATAREGESALLRAEIESGEMTVLAVSDGIGSFTDNYQSPYVHGSNKGGYNGNGLALIPASNMVVAVLGKSLRVYNLETLEEKLLIEDIGINFYFGNPIGSIDGKNVIVTKCPFHPDIAAGNPRPERSKIEAWIEKYEGMPTTYLEVNIETGKVKEVHQEKVGGSHHVQPCPSQPHIWLIDRDLPPRFWCGGDNFQSTRAWLFNTKTEELIELAPEDEYGFQTHTTWNKSGDRIYYHGPSKKGGQYIGVADLEGSIIWERYFPAANYGHVSTHTRADAIITDGLITPDMVTAIYYQEIDVSGAPRIEIMAKHNTQWNGMVGQYPHPHCHMSPDGRWLSYNKAEHGRTDVCIVEVRGRR